MDTPAHSHTRLCAPCPAVCSGSGRALAPLSSGPVSHGGRDAARAGAAPWRPARPSICRRAAVQNGRWRRAGGPWAVTHKPRSPPAEATPDSTGLVLVIGNGIWRREKWPQQGMSKSQHWQRAEQFVTIGRAGSTGTSQMPGQDLPAGQGSGHCRTLCPGRLSYTALLFCAHVFCTHRPGKTKYTAQHPVPG